MSVAVAILSMVVGRGRAAPGGSRSGASGACGGAWPGGACADAVLARKSPDASSAQLRIVEVPCWLNLITNRSLNSIIDALGLTTAVDPDVQVAGRAKTCVCLEGLFGAGHIEAIDGFQAVAILQAERAKQGVGADAEQANPHHLTILLLGHDAGRSHQLGLI